MFRRKRTYLDHAAAAPVGRAALAAFRRASQVSGNPSSPHTEGRMAAEALTHARRRIASLAGTKADAVVFTGNATEANALAILGIVRARIGTGVPASEMHALYLPSAHSSTIGAMERIASLGVATEPLIVTGGSIDLEAFKGSLRPETVLVALEAVCGETGTRFDVRGVRLVLDRYSREHGGRIYLHTDASQLPLAERFELTRLACDTLSLDAQKVGGLRGIGALIAPRQIPLEPLILGGGQERGLRPGTEAVALAASFAAALEDGASLRDAFAARSLAMRARLLSGIVAAVPDAILNGGKDHVPHILNLSFPGRDTDYLVALLDEAGFAVSTRSACETDEPGSRAVLAFTADAARASSTLRISWGPETREGELQRFSDALVRAVRFMDGNAV